MTQKNGATFLLTREQAERERGWFLLDAKGKNLGRLASEIAKILRGKHKANFTPHVDSGDGVVVTNGEQVVVTGGKEAQKVYQYYTGHVGGRREIPYRIMRQRRPAYILHHAVRGMMPKTKQGRRQLKRLRITVGESHGFAAQRPLRVEV